MQHACSWLKVVGVSFGSLGVAAFFSMTNAHAQVDFEAVLALPVPGPTAVSLGDLDGDGIDEAAVLTERGVVVFVESDERGNLLIVGELQAASNGEGDVHLVDLDGNGTLDLVVVDTLLNWISAYLGDGNLGFAPVGNHPVVSFSPSGPFADIVSGDLNGDTKVDLVVSAGSANPHFPNQTTTEVAVLLGDGAGGFGPFAAIDVAVENPRNLVLADFDENGVLDFATTGSRDSLVSILFGNGSGGFSAPTQVEAQGIYLAGGDLDSDDSVDLATSAGELLLGNGSGGFQLVSAAFVGEGFPLHVAELDGDLRDDVVSARGSVFRQLADGSYSTLQLPALGSFGSFGSSDIGDLDGDGCDDLFTPNRSLEGGFFFPGDGTGALGRFAPLISSSSGNAFVRAGDLDGDGNDDLVEFAGSTLLTFLSDGGGGFSSPASFLIDPLLFAAQGFDSADLDRNSFPDLLIADPVTNAVRTVLANGAGGWVNGPSSPVSSFYERVAAGDFDGDDEVDLALLFSNGNRIATLKGDGAASFSAEESFVVGGVAVDLIVADLDRDDHLDLVGLNRGLSRLSIFPGLGNRQFGARVDYSIPDDGVRLVSGDFDFDGHEDIATIHGEPRNTAVVHCGDGNFGFQTRAESPVGADPHSVTVADLNSDELLDLVVVSRGGATLSFLAGDGAGGFEIARHFGVEQLVSKDPVVADFTGDGLLDCGVPTVAGTRLVVNETFDPVACYEGSVDIANAGPVDVVRVNGQVGAGATRTVSVSTGEPLSVSVDAPLANGTGEFGYLLYAWLGGEASPRLLRIAGEELGCFVGVTSLHETNTGLPFRCIRSSSLPARLCRGSREKPGPEFAPFSIDLPDGLQRPLVVRLQALIEDAGAGDRFGYSASNAITLEVTVR